MTPSPFARVEKNWIDEGAGYELALVVGDKMLTSGPDDEVEREGMQREADIMNAEFHARCSPLVEALEEIACLGRPDTPGEFDEPYSTRMARKALEDFSK